MLNESDENQNILFGVMKKATFTSYYTVYNLWVRSTNHIYSRVMHGRRKVKLKTKNRLTVQFKTKNNHITTYGDGTKIFSIEDNFKQ